MEYRSLFETDTDTLLSEISSLEQQQQQQQQQQPVTTQPQSMYSTGQYNYASGQSAAVSANGQYPGPTQPMYGSVQPQQQPQQQQQQQSHYMNANSYYSSQPQQQQMMTPNMKSNWQSNAGPSPGAGVQPPPQQPPPPPPSSNGGMSAQGATTIQNVQINVQNNFNIAKNMQQANLNQFSTASSTTSTTTTNSTGGTTQQPQPWTQYNTGAGGLVPAQYAPNSATTGKPIVNMSNVPQPQQQQQPPQQQQQMYKLNQFGTAKPSPPPPPPGNVPQQQQQQPPQANYMNNYPPGKPQPPPPGMGYPTGQPAPQTVMKLNQPVTAAVPGQPPQQQQQHSAYQQTVNSNTGYSQPLSSLPPHMQQPQQQPQQQQQQQQQGYVPYNQTTSIRQPAPYQPSPNKSQQQPQPTAYATAGQNVNVNSVNLNQPTSGSNTASQQLSPNRLNPTSAGGGYYQTGAYPQQQQQQQQPQQYQYMNQNQPGQYPGSYATPTNATPYQTTANTATTPNRMNTMYNTNINSGGIVVGSGGYPPPTGQNPAALQPQSQPQPQTPMGVTNTNVLNNTISPVGGDGGPTTPTKRGRGKAKPKTDTSSPEDAAGEKTKGKGGKRGKNKQQPDMAVEQTPPTPTPTGAMNAPPAYTATQQQQQQPSAYGQSPSSMNRLPMVNSNPQGNMIYPTSQQPQPQSANMLQRNDYSSLSPQSTNPTSMYKPPQQPQPAYSNHMNMMSYPAPNNNQNQQPNTNANNVQPYPNHSMMQPMQQPSYNNQQPYMNPNNKPPSLQPQPVPTGNSAQPTPAFLVKKPDDASPMMYGQSAHNNAANNIPMSMSQAQSQPQPPQQQQPNVTVGPSNVMMPQQAQHQPVISNQYMPATTPMPMSTNVNTLVNTSTYNMSGQIVKVVPSPNLEPSMLNNHQYHPQMQQPQQHPQQQQPLTSPSQVSMMGKPNIDPMSTVNYAPTTTTSYITTHPTQPSQTPNIVVASQPTVSNTPYMINSYAQQPQPQIDPTKLATSQMPPQPQQQPQLQPQPPQPQPQVMGAITVSTQQSPAMVVPQPLTTPTPMNVQLTSPHEPINGTALPPVNNDAPDSLNATLGESNSTTKSPAKKLTKKQLKLLNNSNGEPELGGGGDTTPSPAKKQRKIRPKKSLDANDTGAPLDPEANSKIDETLDDLMRKFSQQADDEDEGGAGGDETATKKTKRGTKKTQRKKKPTSQTDGEKMENENDDEDESCDEEDSDEDEDDDEANKSKENDEDEDDAEEGDEEEDETKPIENGTNSELDTSLTKKSLKKNRKPTGKKRAERKATIKNLVNEQQTDENGAAGGDVDADDGEPKKAKRKYTKKKFRFQPQSGDEDGQPNASDSLTLTTVKLMNETAGDESQSQSNLLGDESMAATPATGKKGRKPKMSKLTVADESTTSLSALASTTTTITTPTPNITLPQLGPVSYNRGRRKSAHHLVKLMKKTKRKKRKKTSSGEEDADDDDDSDEFELPVTKASAAAAKKDGDTTSTAVTAEQDQSTTTNQLGDELTGCGASMGEAAAAAASNDEATAKLLQASEKRRSTRTTASKRQKYTDEDYKLKDEDLLMPLADQPDEAAAEQAVNGSIVFASHDSLIVDKILGVRLAKRKTKRKKEKVPKPPKTKSEPPADNAVKTEPETTATAAVVKEEKPAEAEQTATKTDETEPVAANAETEKKETETVAPTVVEPIVEKPTSPAQPTLSSTGDAEQTETKPTSEEATKPTDEPMEADKTIPVEAEKPADESMKVDEPAGESTTEPKPEPTTETITTTSTEPVAAVESAPVEESKMEVQESIEDKKESITSETTAESECKPPHEETDKPTGEAVVEEKKPEPAAEEEEEEEEESEWEDDGGEIEVEEFYVKYKNLSYLHCEWKSRDELFYSDKRIDQKIKRFKLKKQQQQQMYDWNDDGDTANGYNNDYDELFNPDYVVIDRILDEYDVDDVAKPGSKIKYFLIKWKALPYEEASWELESDVKNIKKIERFHRFNTLLPEIHLRTNARPKPDKWTPMSESRAYKNDNKLREYQLEGINWLTFCWINGRNCILADEMGLGKTVQSITFLQEVANYGVRGPYLILVPLSTIGNWIREFETWTDFNVIVYHGSSQSRQMIQDYEFYFKEEALVAANVSTKTNKNVVKFNALITTYEVLLSDVPLFCQFKWRSVIIDEAHRLKNKNCKLIEGLRYMDVEHKVLLTGTPLQNNVEELFSLLNFLEPSQFHSSQEFMQEFGDLKTDTQVTKLQAVLKPMMLRRLKEDVEKNLAPKEETIVEVELTNTQKKYYRAILEKNFQFLTRGVSSSNVPNLMNTMMELRKCCNHPYLINGAEDNIIAEFADRLKSTPDEPRLSHDKLALKAMVQASGKLVLVDKLLPKLKAGGHKVLIFSQMIRVLDIIEDYLIQMRFTYERLDGRIRGEMRQEAIDRYSKPDSDRFAFLLCTRAGGLGINLTAADTVIIYDSDWNPQNDLQAQARCHRIGQSKSVKIYRLITRNTYEREMFDRASLKLGLDKAILQSMRNEDKFNQSATANNSMQLSKKEIEDLLKKGAYGAIMEDDAAADKFCEEDIDKILQQRSTVIQIEGGEKGSTFSKASFQTSETNDISIDDPEFWQKWAKKADIDIEEKLNPKDERIIYEPRRRTQTRRYGGPDDLLEESEYSSSSSDENDPNKDQNKDPKTRKGKRGKRGRGEDSTFNGDRTNADGTGADADEAESNVWSRDECYKVEKNLLVFGWSRWSRILKSCEFTAKRVKVQTEQDVESLARSIVAFTLKNYNGDESIKQFIIDLIDPSKSNFDDLKNHQGLAAPVARGRKPRKADETAPETESAAPKPSESDATKPDDVLEWAKNVGDLLADDNYKKHLVRQANRILLRLRMLFYIKHEIIGDEYAAKLDADDCSLAHDAMDLQLPDVQVDLPAEWWDKSCDVSMIVGVYKHGFEKYYQMRTDAQLCFLSLCGPPDATDDLLEQQRQQDNEANEEEKNVDADGVDEAAPLTETNTEKEKDAANSTTADSTATNAFKKFPTVSELNNRLRRLIASVQKFKKQEQLMSKRNAERQEKRLSKLASNQERAVMRQMEKQSKWSRREEQSFYKAISTYGVDCVDKTAGTYSWEKFKEISQLDKKLDETLTDYYTSFLYMCRRVCHKISDDEPPPANEVPVEIISEERASRCLQRIELLNKIRNDVLKSEHFDDWIMNRCLGSVDLPDWYVPGKHDRDLVKAAARYGITRTEYYYVNDREFTFKNYLYKYMMHIEQLMNEDAQGAADPTAPVNSDPIQYYFQNQAKIQITFKDLINSELIAEQEQAAKKSSKLESQKAAKSPEQKETIDEKVKSPSPPPTPTKSPEKQTEPEKAQSPAKETDQVEPEKESANNEKEQKEATNADESLVNKSELNDTSLKDLIIDETVMETSAVKVETPTEEAADKDKENKPDDAPSSPVKVKSETTEDVEMEVTDKASSPAKAKSPAKEKNDDDVQKEEDEEKCKLAVKEEDKSDNKQESSSSKEEQDKPVAVEETKTQPTTEEKEQPAVSKEAAPVEEKVKVVETVDEKEDEKPIEETIMEFTSNNPVIQSYFSNNTVPMIMWPKDRVIYNRLEQIIQMFENDGEWPQRNLFMFAQQQQQATNGAASAVHGSNSNSNLLPANAAPLLNGAPPTNSLSISNLIGSSSSNLLAEQRKLMMSPMLLGDTSAMDDDDDTASNNNDPDSADFYAKLASNPNSQKPKRGRPPKLDLPQLASALGVSASSATAIPADPSNKIRHLLNSIGVAGSPSTNSRSRLNPDLPWHKSDPDSVDDVDIDLPSMKSSSKLGADESANKSGFLEPGEIFRPIGNSKSSSTRSSGAKPQQQQTPSIESENNDSTNGLVMKPALNNNNSNNTKRSRKSMPQQGASAASNSPAPQPVSGQSTGNVNQIDLAALASLFLGQGQDPDERITVINIEDGSRLVGSKAPKRIELPIWLMTHPNYLPDESEIINMTLKNPNIANNLAALYQSSLTGGEAAPQPPPPAPTPPSRSSQRRNNMANNNNSNNNSNNSSSKKQPVESVMSPTHSNELGDDEQELMLPSRPASSSSSITQPSPGRSSSRPDMKSSRPSDKRPVQQLPNGQQAQQPQQSMFDSNSPLVLFNKLTNKRIDRSKIPNWKSLCSFLDKNEHVYIDPCSNELIRSRYGKNIPDIIRSRMLNPKNTKPQQQQPEKQSSPAPQQQQQQRKQPPNKPQQQQQQQQPPAPSTPNAQQQAAAAAANMFNPFSPNSAAQLQGLSELIAASGGNIDFNNPLAGFMAAALAAQSTPGAPPGGFNPFMLPPPLGLPPGAGSSNPLLELLSKMPPGFDMSSLDELTALAALQGAAMAGQGSLPPAPPPTIPSPSLPKPNESKSSMAKNNPVGSSKSKDQAPMRASNDIEMKKKAPPATQQQQQQQQPQSKELRSRDNPTNKPSSMGNKPNSNSIESKLNPPVDVRKPKPGHQQQQQQPQQKQRPMPEQSSKSAKESKAQTSQNAALNNSNNNNNNNNNIDFAAVAAAMQQLDPNTNMAALAAMMEQEKLMQDMMNLSQLTGFGAGNPFLFGAGSFPPPPPPPPPSVHMSKSARARSPSPMERERSVSPANSVASNMSQKQHKSSSSSSAAAANQPPLDFNLFMNNFMNYQLAGGGPLAPPPPPPPLGGLPSLNDLSKLPVELLTALTAAASATGAGGFDPSMFSALAQLNSLSNNVSGANEELTASSAPSSSSRSKPSSSFSKQQTSSSKLTPGSSSSSAKGQSSVRRDASSSSLSSAQLSKKPRMDTSDSGSDFYQQGLDLTLKTRPSSSSGSKHGSASGKPRLKSPLNDD